MKILTVVLALLIATSCASLSPVREFHAVLVNDQGRRMECNFSGFGIMMGNQAHANFNNCIAMGQMNGFEVTETL